MSMRILIVCLSSFNAQIRINNLFMALKDNIQKGRQGELLAKEYLEKNHYRIVETNWHYSKNAEIDIIAEDNGVLVFVEVKTRTSLAFGHPFEAITPAKINKIYSAILAYLETCGKKYKSYRFDGIAVIGLNNPQIEHLKNLGRD